MKTNIEKLNKLIGTKKTDNSLRNQRVLNRKSHQICSYIALVILDELEKKEMSKTELAQLMEVKLPYLSRIFAGKCNLTLETILRLEEVLNIQILNYSSLEHV